MTINGRLCGQRTMNTFWWRVTALTGTVPEVTAFTALHAELNSEFLPKYLACVPENWTAEGIWYQAIFNLRQRKVVIPYSPIGTFADDAFTANVQGSITRVGDIARRDAVGGVRIPIGTTSTSTEDGLLSAALKANFDTFATAMKSIQVTATPSVSYTPMVAAPLSTDPSKWYAIQDAFAQPTTRVIRRRTVGRGI